MGKKEAPPPFIPRPPACLVLVEAESTDDAAREKAMEAEARSLQRMLREQLAQLWSENDTFQRLMYKNRNQHRRALYYRRLSQVRRDLQLLQSLGLMDTLECFGQWVTPRRRTMTPFKATSQSSTPRCSESKDWQRSAVRQRLLGTARLLQQMAEPILDASLQIAALLAQSFFMPFGLTMLASLARFRVLLLQMLYEVVAAFNLVSASLQESAVSLTKPQIAGGVMGSVGDEQPLFLECHWDGVKLVLSEKAPPPYPLLPPPVASESPSLPSVGWFIDDRCTGTKERVIHSGLAGAETGRPLLYVRDERFILGLSSEELSGEGKGFMDRGKALMDATGIPNPQGFFSNLVDEHVETGKFLEFKEAQGSKLGGSCFDSVEAVDAERDPTDHVADVGLPMVEPPPVGGPYTNLGSRQEQSGLPAQVPLCDSACIGLLQGGQLGVRDLGVVQQASAEEDPNNSSKMATSSASTASIACTPVSPPMVQSPGSAGATLGGHLGSKYKHTSPTAQRAVPPGKSVSRGQRQDRNPKVVRVADAESVEQDAKNTSEMVVASTAMTRGVASVTTGYPNRERHTAKEAASHVGLDINSTTEKRGASTVQISPDGSTRKKRGKRSEVRAPGDSDAASAERDSKRNKIEDMFDMLIGRKGNYLF